MDVVWKNQPSITIQVIEKGENMDNDYEILRLKMALMNMILAYDRKDGQKTSDLELDAIHSAMNLLSDYVGEQGQKFIKEMRTKYDRRKFDRED